MRMEERQEPPVAAEPEPKQPGRKNTGRTIGLVLALLVVLAAIAAACYGLLTHPAFTASLRDVTIILLALSTSIIGLFLVVLIFQLQSLIGLLRNEIKPILDSANQTARTVRGTSAFLADSVVKPVITVAGYASGVREVIRLLTGGRKRSSRSDPGRNRETA
jgi:hypothetical protein